ncbi:MAG: hypothetical protein R3284_02285, partial [Rubricoccaceae bacterium]|nr:hypothetical protein [Rubricoccaceae bacterium]
MHFRSYARALHAVIGLAMLMLVLQACDTAPGVSDTVANPPSLSELSFSPLEFFYTGGNDTAQIPLELSARVTNPGGGAITVQYFVRAQFATETIAEGVLSAAGNGMYAASETLSVARGATGLYVITVTIVGNDGAVGNEVTGLLNFTAESLGPPVIDDVDFPSTVVRPAEGQPPVPVPIVATVSDPDGPSNINAVRISTAGGATFDMRDDGGANSNSGDETAGDGRYTITFQVE